MCGWCGPNRWSRGGVDEGVAPHRAPGIATQVTGWVRWAVMPPPPPPPAPGGLRGPPAPPPPSAKLGGGSADRGALLSAIRTGKALKRTQTNDRSAPLIDAQPKLYITPASLGVLSTVRQRNVNNKA
ncbi:hypothetical protein E2C01_068200 [Portunus trituberculatus]|uniref:WH2 domain-containing protein n=1 Tax=Portunus trituberculatus TaxID=210409 RepID=A0A5B7HN99_PORTR|nr:hypothetical protein [Portunus trituberculatus]